MKLKKIVTISFVIYAFGGLAVLVAGLWLAPNSQMNGLSIVKVEDVGPIGINGQLSTTDTATTDTNTAGSETTDSSQTQASDGSSTTSPTTNDSTTPGSAPGSSNPTTPAPTPTPTPKPTPTPAPSPTPTPKPTPACGSAGGSCTAAQVAAHNSQTNCWVIYNNGYYVVTNYVNSHPGGKAVFNSATCGNDITGYMNGSKSTAGKSQRHSNSAYTILNSYYVGPVAG